MIKIEEVQTSNWEGAFRGMRNPMNSWEKADSCFFDDGSINIGENDLKLACNLVKAGSSHRKFMRQVFVSLDITAPLYFMSEFDTYKIGTVRNSCSFMHKGCSKKFEIEDFSVRKDIIDILSLRKEDKAKSSILYNYETEEYKPYFAGEREYKIYKNGKVVSCEYSYTDSKGRTRHFNEVEVIPSVTPHGYWELNLGGKRNREKWLLHRLVAFVWISNPNNEETVDHLNNNKNDNAVENLEWVSRRENIQRAFQDGIMHRTIHSNYINWKKASKLDALDKRNIRALYETGMKQADIAHKYDMSQSQISVCLRNVKGTSDNKDLFELCSVWENILETLNDLRDMYLETKDEGIFTSIRQLLPCGYLYKSTITLDYETLLSMYFQRKDHKLDEWRELCEVIKNLPYMDKFIEACN